MYTFESVNQTNMKALVSELKEIAKSKGYLSVVNFIKDFDLGDIASVSELSETSTSWKLSIRNGHKFEYLTGFNFGW